MPARRRSKGEGTYYHDQRTLADGRTSKFWVYIVSLGRAPDGRRVRRKFVGATKAEAKLKFEQAREKAGGVIKRRSVATVGEYLESWLEGVRISRAARTYATHADRIHRWAIPNLGKMRLDELDQEHISALYAQLALRGVSADGIQRLHRSLRRAFNVAIGRGILRRNPVAFVERPAHREEKRASYDASQVAKFLEASKGARLRAMFRLMLVTALRPGEAYAVARVDLDLERKHLDVRHSLEDVGGELALVPAKADSARRIPLTDEMVAALREHLARMDAEKRRPSPYVFVGERGKWLRTGRVNKEIREVCEAAGLPTITAYGLRHSALSLLAEAGVSARVAADVAGHSTTDLVLDVYTHSAPAMHRDAVERAEALVKKASGGAANA